MMAATLIAARIAGFVVGAFVGSRLFVALTWRALIFRAVRRSA